MALTTHWEWRAFGKLSPAFESRFDRLDHAFTETAPQILLDEYLWSPGIEMNIKFRSPASGPDTLKLKRFLQRSGEFEKWTESPDEVFVLPLDSSAQRLIPQDAEKVAVRKARRAKLWGEFVKVELAQIFSPLQTESVGLEIIGSNIDDAHAMELLAAAITELELEKEDLAVMNYLRWLDAAEGIRRTSSEFPFASD